MGAGCAPSQGELRRRPMDSSNRRKPQAGAVGRRFFEYFLLAAQRKYSAAGLPPANLLGFNHSPFDQFRANGHIGCGAVPASALGAIQLPPATSLDTDPHHLAPPDRIQLRHADLHPRCFKIVEQYLRDGFGQQLAIRIETDRRDETGLYRDAT